jgi:competence protein ComEA
MIPFLRGRMPRPLAALALAGALALAPALAPPPALADGVVNLNTASVEELARLPGVGDARARAIVALREERGRFEAVDELVEVKGIGEASLERMRPFLTLRGPTTLEE